MGALGGGGRGALKAACAFPALPDLSGKNLEGFSGGKQPPGPLCPPLEPKPLAAEDAEPPQNTFVTRSMTLLLPEGVGDDEDEVPVLFELEFVPLLALELLLERNPRPFIRFVSSALARSTTPCADIDISRLDRACISSEFGALHTHYFLAQYQTVLLRVAVVYRHQFLVRNKILKP